MANCHALKLLSRDGKHRKTDVASTEQLLRLIQSVPSKKAEPFKLWLAQVGRERIEETIDPELSIDWCGTGCSGHRRRTFKKALKIRDGN